MRLHRTSEAAFDGVIGGHTDGAYRAVDRVAVEPYIDAGATWWLEDVSPWPIWLDLPGAMANRRHARAHPARPAEA